MSPLFSDLLRLKNVPGARVCQEITLDTMLGAAGEDFKGSYGPDGLTLSPAVPTSFTQASINLETSSTDI